MPPSQRYQKLLRQARRIKHDRLRSKAYDAQMRSDIVHCMLGRASAMETMVGLELKGTVLQGARAVPSLSTIYRVRRCMRVNGRAGCAKGRGGRGIPLGCSQIMALRKWCKEPNGKKRGTRLRMACAWFETVYEERPHRSTMCRWLRLLKLTRKKGTRVAAQQDPERVALFWERCNDVGLDPWETVWFDECGFDSRDFLMEYGYSPEGERFDTVEWLGRGRRINCLSSMTVHGLFAVDFYHNGSITYEVFEHHVLNTIAPRMLQRGLKNLIMDNASIHHACRNRIVRILAMMGILVIWLAPYYPQGNPIENFFGWIKCKMQDHRDELLDKPVEEVCQHVRGLFNEAGMELRAYKWAKKCGYKVD